MRPVVVSPWYQGIWTTKKKDRAGPGRLGHERDPHLGAGAVETWAGGLVVSVS